jgi:hypothetical protein
MKNILYNISGRRDKQMLFVRNRKYNNSQAKRKLVFLPPQSIIWCWAVKGIDQVNFLKRMYPEAEFEEVKPTEHIYALDWHRVNDFICNDTDDLIYFYFEDLRIEKFNEAKHCIIFSDSPYNEWGWSVSPMVITDYCIVIAEKKIEAVEDSRTGIVRIIEEEGGE